METLVTGVAGAGGGGLLCEVLERSTQDPWGEPCTAAFTDGKVGHLLHLCLWVVITTLLQAVEQSKYQRLYFIASKKMQIPGRG